MHPVKQSISIALSLLPKAKSSRKTKNKFFHFAFGYHGNKLLAIGQNQPDKTNPKALKIEKKFNIKNHYPYLHAETDLISRLWNEYRIDSNLTMVIIRLNKNGELRNSKPCAKCSKIIQSLGITDLYWSINDDVKQS